MNYLLAKKPLGGDKSGLLDLQIAKLYLATGERDSAKAYIWKVVDNAGTLRQDSPIVEPLQEVVGAYNTMEAGESDPAPDGCGAAAGARPEPGRGVLLLRGNGQRAPWRIL